MGLISARLVALAAVGGLIGYAAETVHRRAGVWRLPDGADLPLWIAGVYFAALLGTMIALGAFERRLARRTGRPLAPGRAALAFEAALFALLFLAPPLLHGREVALAALATVFAAARLALFRAPGDLAVAGAIVAADLAIEAALVAAGFFTYANAAFAPLPIWLAPLWAGLGLSLRRLLGAAALTSHENTCHSSGSALQ